MKQKISPEEYRNILVSLELDTLYLTEINSKYKENMISSNLKLDIEEKNTFEQENEILKVYYSYKLTAKEEFKEESAIIIQAKYVVRYNLNKDLIITKDFMNIFTEITLGMLLWPFYRELVNNIINRMGVPSLILPLKRA